MNLSRDFEGDSILDPSFGEIGWVPNLSLTCNPIRETSKFYISESYNLSFTNSVNQVVLEY